MVVRMFAFIFRPFDHLDENCFSKIDFAAFYPDRTRQNGCRWWFSTCHSGGYV